MQVSFGRLGSPEMGALDLGVLDKRKLLPVGTELDQNLDGLLLASMKSSQFTGKAHQKLVIFSSRGRIVLYGLGDGKNINENPEKYFTKENLDKIDEYAKQKFSYGSDEE